MLRSRIRIRVSKRIRKRILILYPLAITIRRKVTIERTGRGRLKMMILRG